MSTEKWRLIGGQLYRVSGVFSSGRNAVFHARGLKSTAHVVVSKTRDGQWAVYSRPREKKTENCVAESKTA